MIFIAKFKFQLIQLIILNFNFLGFLIAQERAIIYDSFNRIKYNTVAVEISENWQYDDLGNRLFYSTTGNVCPSRLVSFNSFYLGNKYQWEVSTDSSTTFIPISDNFRYFGVRASTLSIINPTTDMIGYRYRCVISLGEQLEYSPESELRITAIWKGGVDSAWLNPANWECGLVPAPKVDVIIPKQAHAPVITTDVSVESINLKEGEQLIVAPGIKVDITGKPKK